ncbi:MAG: hypothetical protein EOP86_02970 [Verrucomicrobiaceae bacterium]|nr:MAG: hypothetical protein EOP86_02970 [Verrucomicrobiaceae bacterium]
MDTFPSSGCWLSRAQKSDRMVPGSGSSGWTVLRAVFLGVAVSVGSAMAKPVIINLGVLSGGGSPYSFAGGISADGLVVTGQSSSSAGTRAFRWTAAGGMKSLGALPGYTARSVGSALSANGAVITGLSQAPGLNISRAFRWTATTGMQSLGVLGTGSSSVGNAISADGSVITGGSYTSGFTGYTLIRWTAATGMRSLNLPNDNAFAISADGVTLAGIGYVNGLFRALRWTAAGGRKLLGLPSGADNAYGHAISADGSVVAGYVSDDATANTFGHAFRWTGPGGGGDGEMQDLGTLDGSTFSIAWALSADGSVVGGSSTLPGGDRAFLWNSTLGMVDLNSCLPALGTDLTGWTLEQIKGISADGSVITGTGSFNGASRAFVVQGLTGLNVQAPSTPLLTTFQNPVPADSALFGTAVAAAGSDRVLIGAEGAGAAYLLSTGGALITTFHNPAPGTASHFGVSVAAAGIDRVLIGAHQDSTGTAGAGAAYLFGTDGALLKTFTSPAPSSGGAFGWSVAALGIDKVLIGAYGDSTGAAGAGAAYLFSIDGALLKTFTNPAPEPGDSFGWSVAAAGGDRVLIGARSDNAGAGAVYLFSIDGTLLRTFTNPSPAVSGGFGVSVAAVGSDRVIIGADGARTAGNGGAAYLFGTDGTLLTTFNNPTPGASDYFGWSVAAVGGDRVIIGAYEDYAGTPRAGSAHLFSTNGTLLNTFLKPAPAVGDAFGVSVAAVGSDRVLIGALGADMGASHAGAAYLFDLPYPPLDIALSGSKVSISWTTPETGLILQQSDPPDRLSVWRNVDGPVVIDGLRNVFEQNITDGPASRFYRLHRP